MGEREGAREEEGSVKGGTERTAHKFRVRGRGGARGRRHGSSTGHRRATDTHVFLVGRRALLEQILVLSKPVGEEEEEEEGWWCHRSQQNKFLFRKGQKYLHETAEAARLERERQLRTSTEGGKGTLTVRRICA